MKQRCKPGDIRIVDGLTIGAQFGQRCAAVRRSQEPGRVRANSVPLDSGVLAGLTYSAIRFLRRPLNAGLNKGEARNVDLTRFHGRYELLY